MARSERDHVLIGLIGEGIGQSHSPLLHQREADRQGIRLIYTTIDSASRSLDAGDLPDLLRWAPTLGFRGLNVTYPFKQEIVKHLDDLSGEARALGAVNTVVFEDGAHARLQHGLVRLLPQLRAQLRRTHRASGSCSSAPAGPGRPSRTPCSTLGAGHLTPGRPRRRQGRARWPRRSAASSAPTGSRSPSRATCPGCWPRAEGVINATPGRDGPPPGLAGARRATCGRTCGWPTSSTARPTRRCCARPRAVGAPTLHGGGMSVFQAVAAFEYFTGLTADVEAMLADSAELLRSER